MPRLLNRVFFVTVSVAAMMSMEGNSLGQASYRRDQAPGFYRVRMGDFEITAVYDGAAVFDSHWLQDGGQAPRSVDHGGIATHSALPRCHSLGVSSEHWQASDPR